MEQLSTAIKMAAAMLQTLEETGMWNKEDDVKLEKLTKIVNVLTKLKPMEEPVVKRSVTSAQDKEIIQRFLEKNYPAKVAAKKAEPKKAVVKAPVKTPAKKKKIMVTYKHMLHAILRGDFTAFVEKCFRELEPGTQFLYNWHIDEIARKLAGIESGKNPQAGDKYAAALTQISLHQRSVERVAAGA